MMGDSGMTGGWRDDRRTAGRQEDSRTTGGQQDNRRTAGRREDSGTTGVSRMMGGQQDNRSQRTTDDSTPATLDATLGTRRHRKERMVLLVKCTRCCVKEEEGSGEKASIYMILAPTLAPRTTPPATPYKPPLHYSPPRPSSCEAQFTPSGRGPGLLGYC